MKPDEITGKDKEQIVTPEVESAEKPEIAEAGSAITESVPDPEDIPIEEKEIEPLLSAPPQITMVEERPDGVVIVGGKKFVEASVIQNMANRGGPLMIRGKANPDDKQAVEIYVTNYIFSRRV